MLIYMFEFLGDVIMVSVCIGGILVSVCVDKNYEVKIGDMVLIVVFEDYLYLFDGEMGV